MSETVQDYTIDLNKLSNIIIREKDTGFVAALADDERLEMVRGYGKNPMEALNDLHRNLI